MAWAGLTRKNLHSRGHGIGKLTVTSLLKEFARHQLIYAAQNPYQIFIKTLQIPNIVVVNRYIMFTTSPDGKTP